MAQRVHPLSFRLGTNVLWSADWYSQANYAALFYEDHLIQKYLRTVLENRGLFTKRVLIKRTPQRTLIFVEIYANPNFHYVIPRELRRYKKYQQVLNLKAISRFLQTLSKAPVYVSIQNLFLINRIHRSYLNRLRSTFYRYKSFRFSLPILSVFNIVLRTKGAALLTRFITRELEFLERRKKNRTVWKFVSFLGKLVESVRHQDRGLHGLRLQLTGRFRGMSRPKTVRFREGLMPFNTIRAFVDYAYAPAITLNGTFGIKVWVCYR